MTRQRPTDEKNSPSDAARYTKRQREILGVATEVFSERGYRGATIASIAAEAGLSQPGLLHHFPSKDAILIAVIELREQDDLAVLVPAAAAGADILDAMISVLKKNAAQPALMKLFAVLSNEALSNDYPAHDFFTDRYARILDVVSQGVAANQGSGILRDDVAADEIAKLIVAAADGLRYQALIEDRAIEHWRHLGHLRVMLAAGPTASTSQDGG